MKPALVIVVAVLGLGGLLLGMPAGDSPPHPTGFAIVELFTSEGCSSCPPAERLAGELIDDARTRNTPVYVIAYHVDYWDRLGWKDRFAAPEHTQRQHAYARAWRDGRVYTPQMVVNGRVGFIGSSSMQAKREIDAALSKPAGGTLKLTAEPVKRGASTRVGVELKTQTTTEPLELTVVLIEHGVTTQVKRGENRGRTLKHDGVARVVSTCPIVAGEPAEVKLAVPVDVDPARASVIAYVQRAGSRVVIAAAATDA